ncbi:hypothetical protein STCU_00862 [Strigomonas culicis]|uniref:GOLD domain-containing protein n=1 Tax=Strigomonas culicis TaxID=28005 RepID=S9W9D0_9TRYP|nr:hypothetical protein STCU_06228 [Strigomonas culicis]EPY35886.1 hypothetical protein STCU_00862 [Strigomonas culicis]|eukprot:EPY26285.1 hypothetical protein STCU_06228 [Strigomonas culicis]
MRYFVLLAALLLLGSTCTAFQVKPTVNTLNFEVEDGVVCMYSMGADFHEGVSVHYHILYGGDDFDFYVRDSLNKTVYVSYAGEHGLEDRVYFTTQNRQEHSYCFDNRGYSKRKKGIKMDIGLTSLKRWKQRIDPLQRAMHKNDGFFLGLLDDQMLLRMRENDLRIHVEKLYSLMVARGITEVVLIVATVLVNIVFISYLFRRRSKK